MNTDYRMKIGFAKNRKTRRLAKRAGVDGILGLHALFEYTALNRPTGDLSGLTDEKITDICEYDDGNFAEILRETGWLDGEAGACVVHEWAEHQPEIIESVRMRDKKYRKATWARVRRQVAVVLLTPDAKCVYCGSVEDLTLDHIKPQSLGGTHDISNLVVACRTCNSSKNDKTVEEWCA